VRHIHLDENILFLLKCKKIKIYTVTCARIIEGDMSFECTKLVFVFFGGLKRM